ncbi:hypothetical protein PR202_gb22756 [Eleusine coracana subsp. coracana]|uniref:RING-type E3 ubiquitin transferase n=1 Tax=Eleusine coracana subsp. coracana TaxID=191504 RepID=A0AAV5FGL1_ELECO|nr:hypothetical protein PR202_gb22756 [Eleusine coracana subsp. coracana]
MPMAMGSCSSAVLVGWRACCWRQKPRRQRGGHASPPPSGASATAARITPAVLFVTVVLAVVLLVSGLLHVLRRLFIKSNSAGAGAAERQLQQLFFPPHEDGGAGLDQAAIDALPEFAYGELAAAGKGKAKAGRPFDCAVCLTEFADADRLRLLPVCGHAFHLACIDVWLRSSATCPLCRAALRGFAAAAVAAAAAAAAVDDVEEQKQQQEEEAAPASDASAATAAAGSVVLPVRLGRFKNVGADGAEASTSVSPRLDVRRCFSMGSYQYVLSDEQLLVSVHIKNGGVNNAAAVCTRASSCGADDSAGGDDDQQQGKKVYARGDSFSVSKIWQWRGSQRRLPAGLCADDSLPWAPTASTRRESDTAT